MNRNEEYKRLIQELEIPVPALEYTLTRAKAKRFRRKWLFRPAVGLVSVFACFIMLVNFYSPVAYAFSRVPILKDLAEAVTFSRSLTEAVRNEYVQPVALQQTDNGVTARIEYLIVDQKQVNVFFNLESDLYAHMNIKPEVYQPDGKTHANCSFAFGGYDAQEDPLGSITIDFFNSDVPDQLLLKLDIIGSEDSQMTASEVDTIEDDYESDYESEHEVEYVAHFEFLLTFDPTFTAPKKEIEINQIVTLGDQQIKLTNMEVYPTHLRLNVADVSENTAWLKRLDFFVETGDGLTFDKITNGITAVGSIDSPMMVSYRADSPYFYKADRFKIVISGAEWLDKDMETTHLDLISGQVDRMPEGTEISKITRKDNNWTIIVLAKEHHKHMEERPSFHQIFMSNYYDPDGNEHEIHSWITSGAMEEPEADQNYFECEISLKNYPYDEVWLVPAYSHEWSTDKPVELNVQ
ncbi:DUF4179 domain-containing protein [Fusibacter ferrireducens]|uniref:DUF4179 domain-containing protein n=1 Tax=Fusibacter ferrireducens TaxID=2785058 RepID=A0ABR9ZT72_9FIRM|nr:DUF4179 domain-containing protein [Fusibacter ferrireducens]MBF4693075.1 DUF4179 domain-containing protein [Fusibacter ferrireducens]